MMHVDKHNNLVIDDDNPQLLHEIHKENLDNKRKLIKHKALIKLKSQWESIINENVDDYSKLNQLMQLRRESKEKLTVLFPHDINLVLAKSIDKIINKQREKAESQTSVISEKDNYLSTRNKLTQTGKQRDIGVALAKQLSDMEDLSISNIEEVMKNDDKKAD